MSDLNIFFCNCFLIFKICSDICLIVLYKNNDFKRNIKNLVGYSTTNAKYDVAHVGIIRFKNIHCFSLNLTIL